MFVMAKTCISRSWLFCASGLLLIAAGCAQPTATVPVVAPPIPSGQARVWFYRLWEPSESLNLALIDMNGSYVGAAENGRAFYRDVPPGHYHIAPESFGRDFNQDRNVDLAPGQQLYVKILSLDSWRERLRVEEHCARCVLRLGDPAGGRASRNRPRPQRHLIVRGLDQRRTGTPLRRGLQP
jgi:hypothetical protein